MSPESTVTITSAAISPIVIGVISIGVMLIALNISLAIALIWQVARIRAWDDLNFLDHATRQRPWADLADAGPNTTPEDFSITSERELTGGWPAIGSVSVQAFPSLEQPQRTRIEVTSPLSSTPTGTEP